MIEKHGLNAIGRKDTDFKFGGDIDLNNFPDLKKTDKKRTVVNQSSAYNNGIYRSFCTGVSVYSSILSYWNKPFDSKFLSKVIAKALIQGYIIGQGRDLEKGANVVVKTRNEDYPNNKMIYVETELLSQTFREVLQKGYSVVVGYRLSKEFSKDKKDNGIVEGKRFDDSYGGHAISTYFSVANSWKHLNSYPDYPKNIFEVKYGKELIESGTYYKTGYAILPEGNYSIEKIKADKRLKQLQVMTILQLSTTQDQRYRNIFNLFKNIANDPTTNG